MSDTFFSHLVIIIFFFVVLFSPDKTFGEQGLKMNTIYETHDRFMKKLSPSRFSLVEGIDKIFSIPKKKSVGTNSLANSIIFINFEKPEVRYEIFLKEPFPYVGTGKFNFLPLISENLFGYAQKRVFYIYNISSNSFFEHWICKDIMEHITKVKIVDPEKLHFAFGITKFTEYRDKPTVEEKLIRTYDLGAEAPQLIAAYKRKTGEKWTTSDKQIFIFTRNEIRALDFGFNKTSHPLVSFLEKRKKDEKGRDIIIVDFLIHPTLPFAILCESGENASIITWKNDSPAIYPFVNGRMITEFSFSPNGKWFLFFDHAQKATKLVVMPVREDLPHYLGPPFLLGKSSGLPLGNRMAWVNNPLGFVILGRDTLLQWDLSTVKLK